MHKIKQRIIRIMLLTILFCIMVEMQSAITIYAGALEKNLDQELMLDSNNTNKDILEQTDIILGIDETWELKINPEYISLNSHDYFSSNSYIATVDNQGIITGHSLGETIIKVYFTNGEYTVCKVNVKEAPTAIKLEQELIILKVNNIYKIEPVLSSGYSNSNFIYSSSDDNVATVSETGEIKAKSIGTTQITVKTYNEIQTNITIQVITNINSIKMKYLSGNMFDLGKNQSRTLIYEVIPSTASKEAKEYMIWKSSNEKVAVIDQSGKITGINSGKAKITLSSRDGRVKPVTLTVRVTARKKGTKHIDKELSIVNTSKARYTYVEMSKDLNELEMKYGDFLKVSIISKTYDNRNIYQVIIGNHNAKKVMVQSSIHAREYMTTMLTMKQIEFYCKNYYSGIYKNQYFNELFEKVAFYIVPMANPDGVTLSQYGAKGIKDKTLRKRIVALHKKSGKGESSFYEKWKANARGVDLNRNFDQHWDILKNSPTGISSQNYKGTAPVSEIETRALVDLFSKIKPKATISYHATGSIIFWDFGQKGKQRANSSKLVNLAKTLTSYTIIKGFNKNYSTGFSDWVSINQKTPAITIEIGKEACPLNINEFKLIWSKNKLMYLETARLYQ